MRENIQPIEDEATSNTHTFSINPSFASLSKWGPWLFMAFSLLFVALPFLADGDSPSSKSAIIGPSAVLVVFFGLLAWYGLRLARQLPFTSVSVDGDGIWSSHLLRETALIRWEEIHATRERAFLQRLDLLDSAGNVLIKVDYQLSDFELLRAVLAERICQSTDFTPSGSYARSRGHHLRYIGVVVGLSLLGWFVGASIPYGYWAVAVMMAFIAHEYLTTVSSVVVLRDRLRIQCPFHRRDVFRAEIQEIQTDDVFAKSVRYPEVRILVHGKKKPIRLSELNIDAALLRQTLERWRESTPTGRSLDG